MYSTYTTERKIVCRLLVLLSSFLNGVTVVGLIYIFYMSLNLYGIIKSLISL